MAVRFYVEAESAGDASKDGLDIFHSALKKIGFSVPPARIVDFELQPVDDLDRSLGQVNVPDIVGVAEVARMLRVSKQRVSELARSRKFPKPFTSLASGPVWKKGAVVRYMDIWERQPGPKRRAVLVK